MTPTTHAQMRERLERFMARDTGRIAESCRTLAFDHGVQTERATLLFHGLSASPRQLLRVAQTLHARGHNVLVPRLPRHGYRDRLSQALATMDSRQLKACAFESLEIARGMGTHVRVAGFSLGGLLSCYVGQTQAVERAVALSPFLGVLFLPAVLRMAAVRLTLKLPNRFYWWDPVLRERQQPEHGYPRYATHAVAHGLALADELFERAKLDAPAARSLALVLNPFEPAVNNRAIRRLARAWTASKPGALEVVWLKGLPVLHDIVEPKRHPAVAERVNALLADLIDR
ncbi:MAG: alpha/beta hydrolase [Candidatus Baltobacteraceae bacterium]